MFQPLFCLLFSVTVTYKFYTYYKSGHYKTYKKKKKELKKFQPHFCYFFIIVMCYFKYTNFTPIKFSMHYKMYRKNIKHNEIIPYLFKFSCNGIS